MTVTLSQPSGGIGNYFTVNAQPGQTTTAGTLEVRNQTTKQITVLLDPVRGLTASTLGSAYGLRGSGKKGATGWVDLGARKLILGPRRASRVPVSVTVPSGTSPGEYLAGISVQSGAADEVRLEGNLAVSQVQRYAVGLQANLPGPRNPEIKLTGVGLDREPAGVTFKIHGRNSGNVILQDVEGTATVSEGEEVVAETELGPGTFVTDSSIAYPVLVPELTPTQGDAFRVQAELRYKGGVARIDRVVRFGAIDAKRQQSYGGPAAEGSDDGNLLLILLVLAAIGGCIAALLWRRRRPSEGALHRALPREIERARASGEPLSVILVPADGGQRAGDLAPAVQQSLRSRDQLFHTRDTGLIVVAPDTTPEAGEMLAAEIRRQVVRTGNGTAVIPVTSAADSSAEEILEAAEAAASESTAGNGDAGNGHAQGGAAQRGPDSEVSRSGTEAPLVGGDDRSRRN